MVGHRREGVLTFLAVESGGGGRGADHALDAPFGEEAPPAVAELEPYSK
jgi:hypothetical protein